MSHHTVVPAAAAVAAATAHHASLLSAGSSRPSEELALLGPAGSIGLEAPRLGCSCCGWAAPAQVGLTSRWPVRWPGAVQVHTAPPGWVGAGRPVGGA